MYLDTGLCAPVKPCSPCASSHHPRGWDGGGWVCVWGVRLHSIPQTAPVVPVAVQIAGGPGFCAGCDSAMIPVSYLKELGPSANPARLTS